MDTTGGERDAYLIGGRRVVIADLVRAGMLSSGDKLVFRRKRLGEAAYGEITDDHQICLEDGRVFRSPSGAGTAVVGTQIDGWHAWQVSSTDEYLDTLRQRLLDRVAAARASGGDDRSERHVFLKQARSRAEEGDPVRLTVASLMGKWGSSGRAQSAVERLGTDLSNHGLRTDPDFRKVGIDVEVAILLSVAETEDGDDKTTVDVTELEDSILPEVGLTLGNIPSANNGVESVKPGSSLEEAVTLMLLNDYSQIAIMSNERSVHGAVTWQSIARARHAQAGAGLKEASVDPVILSYDTELLRVLAELQQSEFVLVRNSHNVVTGIVTAADVVAEYGQLAAPFFMLGELDQLLRFVVSTTWSMDILRDLCDPAGTRDIEDFQDLSMGDYQRVMESPEAWAALGWPLDRKQFTARLDELRRARNDVMHFNPDPVPEGMVEKARHMIDLIRRYMA